jgi:hypothetical protein
MTFMLIIRSSLETPKYYPSDGPIYSNDFVGSDRCLGHCLGNPIRTVPNELHTAAAHAEQHPFRSQRICISQFLRTWNSIEPMLVGWWSKSSLLGCITSDLSRCCQQLQKISTCLARSLFVTECLPHAIATRELTRARFSRRSRLVDSLAGLGPSDLPT